MKYSLRSLISSPENPRQFSLAYLFLILFWAGVALALLRLFPFTAKSDVKSVCAELTANLKAQGWTTDGSDLINPTSSILKRKRGDASLTIFVKPDKEGSQVRMFTEGLSWEEK